MVESGDLARLAGGRERNQAHAGTQNATSIEENEKGKYRFYGLAFSKRTIFDAGGRPVVYLPDNEGEWIPEEQKWRHVRYEFGKVDWTHEREWRVPGDLT
jgi:hypothetical protein